jgi:hypothetical protein
MSNDDNTNPILYENHRRIIGNNYMKKLCENDDAKLKGEPTIFSLEELGRMLICQ